MERPLPLLELTQLLQASESAQLVLHELAVRRLRVQPGEISDGILSCFSRMLRRSVDSLAALDLEITRAAQLVEDCEDDLAAHGCAIEDTDAWGSPNGEIEFSPQDASTLVTVPPVAILPVAVPLFTPSPVAKAPLSTRFHSCSS